MRFFILFFLNLALVTLSFASTFPRGCEVSGFGYNANYLILNEKGDQSFYMIKNHSQSTIDMEVPDQPDVFMSPKLHTRLFKEQWAAFASDIQNQPFKCFTQENDKITTIDCKEVLDVCRYPRVKFALSNMGNYWVSTNKGQRQVVNDAAAKGILLRW